MACHMDYLPLSVLTTNRDANMDQRVDLWASRIRLSTCSVTEACRLYWRTFLVCGGGTARADWWRRLVANECG